MNELNTNSDHILQLCCYLIPIRINWFLIIIIRQKKKTLLFHTFCVFECVLNCLWETIKDRQAKPIDKPSHSRAQSPNIGQRLYCNISLLVTFQTECTNKIKNVEKEWIEAGIWNLGLGTKFNILWENELWQKKRTKQIKKTCVQWILNEERKNKNQNVKSRRFASVEKLMKENPMNNVTNTIHKNATTISNNNNWIFRMSFCSLPVSNVFELQKVSNVVSIWFDIRCMRVFSHFYGFLQSEKEKMNYVLKFFFFYWNENREEKREEGEKCCVFFLFDEIISYQTMLSTNNHHRAS